VPPERSLEEQALEYQFMLKIEEKLGNFEADFGWGHILDLMFWAYSQGMNDH
jgi:hypothetical protein